MKKLCGLILSLVCSAAFGQLKISQLPTAGTLTGAEIIPMVQAGGTVGATTAQLNGYLNLQLTAFNNNWTGLNSFTQPVRINSVGLTPTEAGVLYATPAVVGQAAVYSNGTIVSTGNTLSHANQTVTNTQVYIQGGSGEIVTDAGAAGADAKIWSFVGLSDGTYRWRIQPDNLGAPTDILVLTRTAATSSTYKIQPSGTGNQTVTFSPNAAGIYLENVSAQNSAGISNGSIIFAGTNTSDNSWRVVNAANTQEYALIRGDGQFRLMGVVQPRTAWAQIVQGAGTCSIGGGSSSGGIGSCTFSATGVSNVSLAAEGFANSPSCNATIVGAVGSQFNTSISGVTSTNATVNAAIAGVATNSTIYLICVGT